MIRLRLCAILAALPLALSACGGGSDGTPSTTPIADRSAPQILDGVADALAGLHNYHLLVTQTDEKDGQTVLDGDITADGRVRMTMSGRTGTIHMVVVDDDSYFKANAAFWRNKGGRSGDLLAARLADRWVKSPGGVDPDIKRFLHEMSPKTLGYCTNHDVGTVSKAGRATVDGQPTIALVDHGGPGSAPSKMYVSTTGKPLPLRVVQIGPEPPGHAKKGDPKCDDGEDGSSGRITAMDIRLSRFDVPLTILAPPSAIDLSQLGGNTINS